MGKTIRLTTAQALVKFLTRQMTLVDGKKLPIFAGVWAIFGHGNVVGIGELSCPWGGSLQKLAFSRPKDGRRWPKAG